jgi:hypothetical protein
VLLRFRPGDAWPVLLGAVRDEFRGRPWDPPAAHWGDPAVQGGRDRQAGGTWLAVDRSRGVVSALLNGVRRPEPPDGRPRPTRGTLALAALRHPALPGPSGSPGGADGLVPGVSTRGRLADYDGFHLVRADPARVDVWSWDGAELAHVVLGPGNHIVVNLGVDRDDDPLVPYFRPRLAALAPVAPAPGPPTGDAWGDWVTLLRGDGLDLTDPRALIIDHEIVAETGTGPASRHYGSTSASLIGIRADRAVRYDFTGDPRDPRWGEIPGDLQ